MRCSSSSTASRAGRVRSRRRSTVISCSRRFAISVVALLLEGVQTGSRVAQTLGVPGCPDRQGRPAPSRSEDGGPGRSGSSRTSPLASPRLALPTRDPGGPGSRSVSVARSASRGVTGDPRASALARAGSRRSVRRGVREWTAASPTARGPVDGGGENSDQAAQADGRQVASPDHGADGLLVAAKPARGVWNGEKQGRERQDSRAHPDTNHGQDECHARGLGRYAVTRAPNLRESWASRRSRARRPREARDRRRVRSRVAPTRWFLHGGGRRALGLPPSTDSGIPSTIASPGLRRASTAGRFSTGLDIDRARGEGPRDAPGPRPLARPPPPGAPGSAAACSPPSSGAARCRPSSSSTASRPPSTPRIARLLGGGADRARPGPAPRGPGRGAATRRGGSAGSSPPCCPAWSSSSCAPPSPPASTPASSRRTAARLAGIHCHGARHPSADDRRRAVHASAPGTARTTRATATTSSSTRAASPASTTSPSSWWETAPMPAEAGCSRPRGGARGTHPLEPDPALPDAAGPVAPAMDPAAFRQARARRDRSDRRPPRGDRRSDRSSLP